MKLTVLIPAYNEEQSVLPLYQRVTDILLKDSNKNNYDFELIYINDGSKDNTLSLLRDISEKDERIKYISFSRNFGKEAAMFAGLNYSDGDYTVIIDADLQHPPELIPKMLHRAMEGYDQVIAKRNRTGDKKGRTFLSKLYYKVVNGLIDVKLEDGIGDFRVLSKKSVRALTSMKEYTRFSKGLFSWIGFKTDVFKYENVQREAGETKWTFKKLLSYAMDGIMSFNDRPLRISIYLGFITMILGLIYILYSLLKIAFVGIETPGYFTLISSILIVGGVQLISIGILGEYIGKIYYEVKKRPHYLVQETNLDERKKEESYEGQ